ncbi:MAG: glycosyltransferase family 39 protein [Bryobacteraceae bacterium]|jgi:4-amino-4-deoxy-L-arabinose transferase-like glycosyltransferase
MSKLAGRFKLLMRGDRLAIALECVIYAAVLWWLMRLLPFWLDEATQLAGTTQPSFGAFLAYHRYNAGGVPLGYLLQFWLIATFGLGFVTARLPSALASLLACVALAGLGREAGIRSRTVLLAVFMILPIQLRYAVEGRNYSHGLLFAVVATWCLVRLDRSPGAGRGLLYALAVAASFYSQGFAAFIQPGQVATLALTRRWRSFAYAAAAFALACLSFVPWYIWTKSGWQHTIAALSLRFEASPHVALVLLREISGDGWAASLPLIAGAVYGFRRMERRTGLLLAGGILSGVALGLAVDYRFHYFFAIRQFIFVVPALTLLAVHGLLESRRTPVWGALVLLFAGGALAKNYTYFSRPHEDVAAAARLLLDTAKQGPCIAYVPSDDPRLYAVFEPALEQHRCGWPPTGLSIAFAANIHSEEGDRRNAMAVLGAAGYQPGEQRQAGGTTVTLFRERAPSR